MVSSKNVWALFSPNNTSFEEHYNDQSQSCAQVIWLSSLDRVESRVTRAESRVESRLSSHCFFQGPSPESSCESSVSNPSLRESLPTKCPNHATITWKHSDTTDTVSTLTLRSYCSYSHQLPSRLLQFCSQWRTSTCHTQTPRVQNSPARIFLQSDSLDHSEPLLRQLHWLPVHSRIRFKLNCHHHI